MLWFVFEKKIFRINVLNPTSAMHECTLRIKLKGLSMRLDSGSRREGGEHWTVNKTGTQIFLDRKLWVLTILNTMIDCFHSSST